MITMEIDCDMTTNQIIIFVNNIELVGSTKGKHKSSGIDFQTCLNSNVTCKDITNEELYMIKIDFTVTK